MNFLSMINFGALWGGFGAVSLISLIWFGGSYLQIGSWRPLEPNWVKILLSVLIVLVLIGVNVYKWYKQKQLNKNVIEELKASDLSSDTKSPNKHKITEQFNSVDLILQKHDDIQNKNFIQRLFIDKKNYIYQKPWFLIVGAPGVGKTTSILNSGLKFPIGTVENTSKLAGTQDCDWFLTDDAVLIDTAGRFVEQGNQSKNSEDWQELLHLLKRCRTKQPINGLVLMIGADDLIKNNEDYLENQLSELRVRLQEIQNSFNISFPFYLVVNKIDLIAGFGQYFNYLTEEDRNKVFGISLDIMSSSSAEKINLITEKLDKISESIKLNIFNSVIYNNQQNNPSDLALSFASEFSDFSINLKIYLKKLLSLSKYDSTLHLGGIYFASSTQQDVNMMEIHPNPDYQLKPKYIQDSNNIISGSKPYFINHFYQFVLMESSNLAGTDATWLKKQKIIYWGICFLLLILSMTCIMLFIQVFFKNSKYLDKVEANVNQAHAISNSINGNNALEVLDFSNKVRIIPSSNIPIELTQRNFFGDFGLNNYDTIYETSQQKYRALIEENLNGLISQLIKDKLKKNIEQESLVNLYQNLKAYLMLYNEQYYDGKFIAQWVQSNLSNSMSVSDANFEQLEYILRTKKINPVNSQNLDMVNKAREILANQDVGNMIYADLIEYTQTIDTKSMPSVSFVSMGGPTTQNLFRRVSGKTLNSPMPILYTKYGYKNLFLPYVNTRLDNIYNTESWVMPSDAFSVSKEQVLSDIYQKYTNDYITYWQQYISDIRMLEPKNLQQTIVMSKQLSEKNSSLAGIIRGIYDNTNLVEENIKETIDDVANDSQSVKDVVQNKTTQKEPSKTNETSAQMWGYLQDVASHFSQFHILAQNNEGTPSQLDEIAKSINDLYVYLVALQMSMQNNDALMPDNKPVINYQAQISRLPDPFRPMLDQFVGQISQTSKDYQQTHKDEQAQAAIDEQKKTVLAIAEQQDNNVKQGCETLISGKYPFDESASQEVSLDEFSRVFGSNGLFVQTLQSNILVNERLSTPFSALLEGSHRHQHYQNAQRINTKFLAGSEKPMLDFTMKVMAMDKNIKELSIGYDDTKTTYYHGPQKNIKLSWPSSQKNMVLKAVDFNNQSYTLETKGDWSIFRLIDKATKIINTKDNKGVIATFDLDNHEVHIEFKSISGNNPFLLSELKEFLC